MAALTYISLGAGVQSTTLLLRALHGDIDPMPDCGIFADTQDEPQAVYRHLEWLEGVAKEKGFPIHRCTQGKLSTAVTYAVLHTLDGKKRGRFIAIPAFGDRGGMGRRQCTPEFKLTPLYRKVRELLGKGPRAHIAQGAAVCMLGITTDEASRMKPATVKYMVNTYPLIDLRMNRQDCVAWLLRNGLPDPAEVGMCVLPLS